METKIYYDQDYSPQKKILDWLYSLDIKTVVNMKIDNDIKKYCQFSILDFYINIVTIRPNREGDAVYCEYLPYFVNKRRTDSHFIRVRINYPITEGETVPFDFWKNINFLKRITSDNIEYYKKLKMANKHSYYKKLFGDFIINVLLREFNINIDNLQLSENSIEEIEYYLGIPKYKKIDFKKFHTDVIFNFQ